MKLASVILLVLLVAIVPAGIMLKCQEVEHFLLLDADDKTKEAKEPQKTQNDILCGEVKLEELLLVVRKKPHSRLNFSLPFPFFNKQTPPPDCSC